MLQGSLICVNGTRMTCNRLLYNDKGGRLLIIFLSVIVALTFVVIVHIERENSSKTLIIQAKYTGSTNFKGPTDTTDDSLSYGIIFDCGSSGSRVYLYFWPPHGGGSHQLLDIHQMIGSNGKPLSYKIKPGLSTYSSNSTFAAEYLRKLLDFAAKHIPREKHKETPLYIMATAGMRLISKTSASAILDDVIRDVPKWYDFEFDESHVSVISGKEEGMYAWISLNYMLGRFSQESHRKRGSSSKFSTAGVVDMGGGSLQIAFEVDQSKLKNKDQLMTFSLSSQKSDTFHNYNLYVTTFLGFGANSVLKRYQQNLVSKAPTGTTLSDPCQSLGAIEKVSFMNSKYKLKGTGDVKRCMTNLTPLLNQTRHCSTKPCSLDGVYQPAISSAIDFYGISEYFYSTNDVLGIKGHYNYEEVLKLAQEYCGTQWSVSERKWNNSEYPNADMARMRTQCFKVSWILEVLHTGLHFSKKIQNFYPVDQIDGQEVQWSLGALIHKTRFLAAKQRNLHTLTSTTSDWSRQTRVVLPYLMGLCFVIVVGAILLYCRYLQKMKVVPSLRNVPSMSYFMTNPEDKMELGLIEERSYYPHS